jgi:hypothetical protein
VLRATIDALNAQDRAALAPLFASDTKIVVTSESGKASPVPLIGFVNPRTGGAEEQTIASGPTMAGNQATASVLHTDDSGVHGEKWEATVAGNNQITNLNVTEVPAEDLAKNAK